MLVYTEANRMQDGRMCFLDSLGVAGRDSDTHVTLAERAITPLTHHGNRVHASQPCSLQSSKYVGRASAGRHNQKNVAFFPQAFNLAAENAIEAVIVTQCRYH